MLVASDPITKIPGVGPRYKKLLENLDIHTPDDFLRHLPTRYEKFKPKSISSLMFGDKAAVKGQITSVQNIFTKNKKKITKAVIQDSTGKIDAIWFNQHYIAKTLRQSPSIELKGKVDKFSGKPALVSPKYSQPEQEDTLTPVYPLTEGLTQKYITDKIGFLLKNVFIPETLPQELLSKEKLHDIKTALKMVHKPVSEQEIAEGRKRLAIEELLRLQIKIKTIKRLWQNDQAPCIKYRKEQVQNFIKKLPFTPTKDQTTAFSQILEDIAKPTPMNRILIGDVGSGKTLVAVLSAYNAALEGLNTAYLAPTEVLAQQHYNYFTQMLKEEKVSVNLITSSQKLFKKDAKPSITIGTHALLFNPDLLKNISLLIIDEQQRFGVKQRTKLLNQNQTVPHLLTMTATPIPRSYALTLYGELNTSFILEKPGKRKKIITRVVNEEKRATAYDWVGKQITEARVQAYIVCPFIEQSSHETLSSVKSAKEEFERLREIFSGHKLALLHGKLKSAEKHAAIDRFKNKEIEILVTTPVIEVGIDVPEANIIIIEGAERFGLASLHQLRGRVGRNDQQAYCLLFTTDNSATKRLRYMEKYDDGFKLAETDLQIRGQGQLFGTIQSGFAGLKIADIGDMEQVKTASRWSEKVMKEPQKYQDLLNSVKTEIENVHLS